MKGLKKQRRIQLLAVSVLSLSAATTLIGYGLRDGIAYFRSPVQILEDAPGPDEVFRVGGQVAVGSLTFVGSDGVWFLMTDGQADVKVTYKGILPDLFDEGQGAIALGRYVNEIFEASEILAKHDETYLPREVAKALKDQGVYRESKDD